MERWPCPQEAPGDDGPQLHRACLFLIAIVLSPAYVTGCPGGRDLGVKKVSFFVQEWASVPGSGVL